MNHTNIKRFRFINNGFFALFLVFALILPIPTRSHAAPKTMPASPSLPQEANAPISAAIGADQPSYHATADRDGFQVDNAQGLSAHFTSSGVDFYAGEHTWGLSLASYGYGEDLQPVISSEPTARANRIEYPRGNLTEWYVNGPFGLEQGFTLAAPPTSRSGGPLTLALSMSGDLNAAVDTGGKGLSLSASDGTALLRYTGLMAYDANGRELSTWLEIQSDKQSNSTLLFLRVNDIGARYPLTIDPFVQKAKLTAFDKAVSDYFGTSVSISGDVVVVGAYRADPGGTSDAGAAYVFGKPGGGWADMTQTAKLTASDKAADGYFGSSVSINGNVVVVGAPGADPGGTDAAGAAYVFVKPGGGWDDMTQTAKLTASDKAAGVLFGQSVSISGDVVVVGANRADPGGTISAGAAYVFVKPGGGWVDMTQTAKLTASDKAAGDLFGQSVSISGDVVVVGANRADPGGTSDAGAAYVFGKPGGGWTDMTQTAKLTASDKAEYDYFGYSVSISGYVVVVGAGRADPGGTDDAGAAYIFAKPGGGWTDMTQTARLTASDKAADDEFGYSVSISGDVVVVGAVYADPGGTLDAGATYVFVNCDSTTTTITSDSPAPSLVGGTVNVSVTVSGGSTTPSGTVDITGADTNCSISLSGGSGNCNVTFDTVGAKTLTATYNGDTTHAGSSDTENHAVMANTTTTIVADTPDPSAINQVVTVNFTVTVNSPGSGTPTGDVTVSDGVDSCLATVAAGSCTMALNTLGTRSLTATYPGDTNFNGSSDTENHKVEDNTTTTIIADTPDPSAINQVVTVGANVTGGPTKPTGTVSIDGADANCVITLSAGSGICNALFTSAGAKTLTATYNGDTTHAGSSDTEEHAVIANTTTTITSDSPDPSLVGGAVNVSVTVSGGSTPSGTVDITGADTNCSISLSGGSGNCNVTFNTDGAKTLTATYNGDATHLGSSDTEDHAVMVNTTTTITSDAPDPSTDGQNVTVNFTVTVNFPGSGTPTGDVTVSDGVDSCSASVAAGSCTLALNTLGNRILTATYPGNTDFNSSSDTESHKVNPLTSNFYSAGTYDGWIIESSETSGLGGSVNAIETTFRLGDDASDRQYRSILSFNTAGLPDNAVITSIVIKIKKQGLVGTNPFTTHQGLLVDIRKPYFGPALGLAASDFQALASKGSVGTFGTTPSTGWYSVTLNSTARPYINKTGSTQFRLRFKLDDNDDMGADYMKFYSGNFTTTSSRPLLIIQYYLP